MDFLKMDQNFMDLNGLLKNASEFHGFKWTS